MLKKLLEIKEKDIITVVGAGGKTSFIKYLTKEFSSDYRVLSTTTTKIYLPKKSDYNNTILIDDSNTLIVNKGITICGKYINKEKKVVGLNFNELDNILNKFDISFIEGDGSKRKKLKGWREDEPLVHPMTTKNIGIVDISSFNMDINNENIHRLEKFLSICGNYTDKVNLENLKNIILHKDGLFKNSVGEKILYINKVDDKFKEVLAKDLIKLIKKEDDSMKIIYGSLTKNYYKKG